MTVTAADFTGIFPEFGNAGAYPDPQVTFWLGQAYSELNARRFGKALDLAAMLFTAHNLVLSARNAAAASVGAPVGAAVAPVSSKAVGPVSTGYDTAATTIPGAGIWNATSYGQRLYKMMQSYGSGPVYVAGRGRVFPF